MPGYVISPISGSPFGLLNEGGGLSHIMTLEMQVLRALYMFHTHMHECIDRNFINFGPSSFLPSFPNKKSRKDFSNIKRS